MGQGLGHDCKDPTNPVLVPNCFNERADFTSYLPVKGERAFLLSQLFYLILFIEKTYPILHAFWINQKK